MSSIRLSITLVPSSPMAVRRISMPFVVGAGNGVARDQQALCVERDHSSGG